LEGWPRAENLAIFGRISHEGLTAQLLNGNIGNIAVRKATCASSISRTAEMQLQRREAAISADALGYLRATPLDAVASMFFQPSKPMERCKRSRSVSAVQGIRSTPCGSVHAHSAGGFAQSSRRHSRHSRHELYGDCDIDGPHVAHADVHGNYWRAIQMQARSPRNRPFTRTVLVFNGVLGGDALHSGARLPASIAIGGTTGLARCPPSGIGTGSGALAAYHGSLGRT